VAAEVLSRSTRLHDRNTKLDHYARIGVQSYWLLNPVAPGSIEVRALALLGVVVGLVRAPARPRPDVPLAC